MTRGVVYLLHAEQGLHVTGNRYAQHYLGWATDYTFYRFRLSYHRRGEGSRLVRAWNERQIDWTVSRIWDDADRYFERRIKNQRNMPRHCPICAAERRLGGYSEIWPPGHPPRTNLRELQEIRAGLRWYRTKQSRVRFLEEILDGS